MSAVPAALDYLGKASDRAARLSIWHLRSFVVGVQIAGQGQKPYAQRELAVYDAFTEHIQRKYGDPRSQYEPVWTRAATPRESVDLYLSEWAPFRAKQPASTPPKPAGQGTVQALDVHQQLFQIEQKPHFYVLSADITHLKALVEGISFVAEHLAHQPTNPDFPAFEQWLRSERSPGAACSWDMLITLNCGGDITAAFRRFFDELRRFEARNQQHKRPS